MPRKKQITKKNTVDKAKKRASILQYVTKSEDFIERRKTARLDVPIKVQYRITGKKEKSKGAVTKDVSVGGCLILLTEKLPIDSIIELEIFLGEKEEETLKLRGRIARLNRKEKALFEYGIAFDTISAEARRLFADYFFAKMYEMIGLPKWPTATKTKEKPKH